MVKTVEVLKMISKKSSHWRCLDEITEADATPSFDNIESALKGFQDKVFKQMTASRKPVPNRPREEDSTNKKHMSDTNDSITPSISTCTDSSVMQQKEMESNKSVAYPTKCQFCGGMLRAIDKYRKDQKLTLQCRNRKCLKFNGLTADKHAKQFLSKLAKPKAPKIDYGWYLSDPVRHSYRIFADHSNSSDLENDRSDVNFRPVIRNGSIMLRVFGQKRLAELL